MGIIYLTWVAFGLFWLAAAFTNKSTVERQPVLSASPYRVLVIIGLALVFGAGSGRRRGVLRLAPIVPHSPLIFAGAAISVLGLALALWARVTIGRNWSASVTYKQDHELVTNGPYQIVRHPIYTALVMMSAGTAVAVGGPFAYLGVVLVFTSCWIKLGHEERLMVQHFPRQYPGYAERTKRIIPFVL